MSQATMTQPQLASDEEHGACLSGTPSGSESEREEGYDDGRVDKETQQQFQRESAKSIQEGRKKRKSIATEEAPKEHNKRHKEFMWSPPASPQTTTSLPPSPTSASSSSGAHVQLCAKAGCKRPPGRFKYCHWHRRGETDERSDFE